MLIDSRTFLTAAKTRRIVIEDARGRWAHATRRWRRRNLHDIQGLVLHQTAGGDSLDALGRYHTQPGVHIGDGQGLPGIAYTFFVNRRGRIHLVNDLEDVTWSHGDASQPGDENRMFMSACFGGSFTPSGREHPSDAQRKAFVSLWLLVRDVFKLGELDLLGHFDFGKPSCPGDDIRRWIEEVNKPALDRLASTTARQQVLERAGFPVGPVDGAWGPRTQAALEAYQRARGLRVGGFDRLTLRSLSRDAAASTRN